MKKASIYTISVPLVFRKLFYPIVLEIFVCVYVCVLFLTVKFWAIVIVEVFQVNP